MDENSHSYAERVDYNQETMRPSYTLLETIGDIWSWYGWLTLATIFAFICMLYELEPYWTEWRNTRKSAQHHKNEDDTLEAESALRAARARQQEALERASQEYNLKKEQQQLNKKTTNNSGDNSGNRLGRASDYFPLCGTGSTSNYKPPKKSKCGGGGCGK